ncbi:MAG: DUF2177 family protein [Bacteroidota bacterium]
MPLSKLLLSYVLISLVFFAIDIVWLGFIGKNLYQKQLGHLLRADVNWTAAFVFYALYIVGIMVFCILPAAEQSSLWYAVTYGAFFGFITYATYDLTNLATLEGWPLPIVFIDITWGTFLGCLVSTAGYFIVDWLT